MNLNDPHIKQILDTIDAHTVICDKQGVVLANTIALEWLGISEDDLPSLTFESFVHPTSMQTVLDSYQSLKSGAFSSTVRISMKHPHLGNIWLDVTAKVATFIDEGRYWMMTFVPLRNLPIVREGQSQSNSNQSYIQNEFVSADPLLATIIEENHFVDTALNTFFSNLREFVPYASASIALAEPDGLRVIASRNLPEALDTITKMIIGQNSIAEGAEILLDNTSIVYTIRDTRNSKIWMPFDKLQYMQSWMGVELYYNQQVIGILNINSDELDFFTKEHAEFALALSQQAILALIYTRLYQRFHNESEEHRRLQRILVKNLISTETMFVAQNLLYTSENFAETLPDLAKILAASMDHTEIIAVVFNLTTNKLIHRVQTNYLNVDLWETFAEVIQQTDLPEGQIPSQDIQFATDGAFTLSDGRQAIAGVINTRGALIAVRENTSDVFDETDQELIVTIANQMTIALKNEILRGQVRQQTQHLQRVVDRRTEQLSVERKRLQAILDSTAEGIFYMENFKLQYANPAFCNMVGYELDDLYGKPLSFLRVATASSDTNFTSLLDNSLDVSPGRSETRLRHRDGAEFYASIRFSLVGQPGENPVRMVAIARDVSQERKLYIQRARFIANAAHELRTPLSSLVLRLHMLRRQPERMDTHLESLDKVTNYLKDLVEEMLTITRFERGKVELARENYVLQSIILQAISEQSPFAEEQHVTIEIELPDDDITMRVDGKRMHQMVSNLLVNGINYSPPESIVRVTLSVEIDSLGNENAILYVIDEGEGIEPDLLPDDIFEPFSRPSGGKRKETGMGLALVKEIINLHGGTIRAKSKAGQGASFRISLPLN